jgi:ribosomal protein L44E
LQCTLKYQQHYTAAAVSLTKKYSTHTRESKNVMNSTEEGMKKNQRREKQQQVSQSNSSSSQNKLNFRKSRRDAKKIHFHFECGIFFGMN